MKRAMVKVLFAVLVAAAIFRRMSRCVAAPACIFPSSLYLRV
ncbi:MAG: hypothetical protein WBG50_06555 [Desulfomonilaceae bacterium]